MGPDPGLARPDLLCRDLLDSLFVLQQGRWIVFDPDLEFARSVQTGPMDNPSPGRLHRLDNGWFVGSDPAGGRLREGWLMRFSSEAEALGRFGGTESRAGIDYTGEEFGLGRPQRALGYGGGPTVWVGPPGDEREPYVLEEWDTRTGELVREFVRDVTWFRNPVRAQADVNEPFALPFVVQVHVDGEGLLWVYLRVPDEGWTDMGREEWSRVRADDGTIRPESGFDPDRFGDLGLEVIDPAAGVLLASARVDAFPIGLVTPDPPFAYFLDRSRRAYRGREEADGFTTVEFFDLHLVERR